MTLIDNIRSIFNPPKKSGTVISGNQPGKGYPVFQPARDSTTNDNEPILLPDGTIGYPPGSKGGYGGKRIQKVLIDCSNAFINQPYSIAGSLIWFSGQNGGTAAPIYITLCNAVGDVTNDNVQFVYDRAISGIPFQQILVSNPNAQPGVTIELTVILDNRRDRVGLNG